MRGVDPRKLSRRDFARASALAAAAAALLPGAHAPAQQEPPSPTAKLPQASAAEAEARYQMILGKRGSRLTAEQKADLRKGVFTLQGTLDSLRAFALDNADEPALVLQPRPPRGK